MARKDKGFWAKFDELFDKLPGYVNEQIKSGDNSINTVGHNNVVVQSGSSINQRTVFGTSVSTISQGGKKIEIKTKNGKTTIKVNGKEVYKEDK